MIPCLRGPLNGLSLFAATADQRVLLGEEIFLRTHMPLTFQRYQSGAAPITWSESDLLSKLSCAHGVPRGNRVFLLYGAAGAGKSETLRWLQLQITRNHPLRTKALVRIPRTELDPVLIVDAILRHFGESGLTSQLDRWNALKQKPVSLANQVIWGALGDMLNTDDEIIPLSYKLRPVVEANLRQGIHSISGPEESARPVELLTREQLQNALVESSLNTQLPYEPLLARMREELDQALLGDVRLVPSLRRLSRMALEEWNTRPILLIDDLVQSLNVYASDLLDYFLTLEEGDWDVVIGLTPASFEGTERTRELLQRINQLDTVDDRVTRLFLSDARGDDSAFLYPDSLGQFLEAYLHEFKRLQGYECGPQCPSQRTCQALQLFQRDDTVLAPFNPSVLRRMFRRLPRGKGKPRYLLLTVAELLRSAHEGPAALIDALQRHAERDQYAISEDRPVKSFVELYAPDGHPVQGDVIVPPEVMTLLGRSEVALPLSLQPLLAQQTTEQDSISPAQARLDPDAEAVRNWLEGTLDNPESLKPFRMAIARWLRELGDPARLTGRRANRSTGILRWSIQTQDCDLPIILEGIDQGDGITVPRAIGPVAFDLLRYAQSGSKAREAFLRRIFKSPLMYELTLHAQAWSEEQVRALESAIQMPVDLLAHHLMNIVLSLGLLADAEWVPVYVSRLPDCAATYLPPLAFGRRELEWITALWHDNYRIRDNVFRGTQLRALTAVRPDDSITAILKIDASNVPYEFVLGGSRLRDFLVSVQQRLQDLGALRSDPRVGTELQRFLQVTRAAKQLADPNQLTAVRRLVYQVNQLRRSLPELLKQQLPDLLPPRTPPDEPDDALASEVHVLLEAPAKVPTVETLYVVYMTQERLNGPLRGVGEWITRLEQTHRLISLWSAPNPNSHTPLDPQCPVEMLKNIASDLRTYRHAKGSGQNSNRSDQDRWNSRLQTLEALLPRRSILRSEYQPTFHELRLNNDARYDWTRLELTISRAATYWRTFTLIQAEQVGPGFDLDGVLRFLSAVIQGKETATDVALWKQRLVGRVLQTHGERCSHVFTPLLRPGSPPTLQDLSYRDLLDLKSKFPQLASRLIVSASEW